MYKRAAWGAPTQAAKWVLSLLVTKDLTIHMDAKAKLMIISPNGCRESAPG